VEMMMASSHHSITQLSFLLQPKEFWGINCTNNTKLSATKVVFLGNIYSIMLRDSIFNIPSEHCVIVPGPFLYL
jgi:hypothetical protein